MARALNVTLIAGTLYNLINQDVKIVCRNFGEIDYLKITLTYLMPFQVPTYIAVSGPLEA